MELQQALSSCAMDTYNEALDKALTTETNPLRVGLIKSDDKKKDSKGGEHKSGEKNSKNSESCPRCDKVHLGRQCFLRHVRCYACGENRHKEKDYPKNKEAPLTGN